MSTGITLTPASKVGLIWTPASKPASKPQLKLESKLALTLTITVRQTESTSCHVQKPRTQPTSPRPGVHELQKPRM